MSVSLALLWDFAGFDGLALARNLFGSGVSELAVYQSLDVDWNGLPISLLRLCENNFRVGLYGEASEKAWGEKLQANTKGQRVWVKPSCLVSLFLEEGAEWQQLEQIATTKAPYRLAGLANNRAVPSRVADRAALVWRHSVEGICVGEIHAAPADCTAIRQSLRV